MKSLWKIIVLEEQILYYDLVFNNNDILIITVNNIKTWEPLSVLFTEIILKNNSIFPKNHFYKSFKYKNLSDEKE